MPTNKKELKVKYTGKSVKENIGNSRFFLPVILILTALIFTNLLGNDFASWDDSANIINNQLIKQLNWNTCKEIFQNFHGTDFPLTIFSYTLEYKFFGLNPFYYHLTNYIFHLINVILVFLLIRRVSGNIWIAAITSLFFGIHPMHVESVAWISERKDILYSFFFLLSLISYCNYVLAGKKITDLSWSVLWFLLSMLSKPAAACLPLVLLLIDYYFDKKISLKNLLTKLPFAAIVLFFIILTVFVQKTFVSIPDLSQSFNIVDKVFLFSYSTVYYIVKAIAPFHLCAIHFYPVKTGSLLPLEYYLALPALLILTWTVINSKFLRNEIIFGMLFYFITIVMVLQIIPVGQQAIVAERYSYIPYIGIFYIIGHFFSYILNEKNNVRKKTKSFFLYLVLISVALFCFLTYERNNVWKNGVVLFTDVINKYPGEGYSWFGRGFSRYEKGDNKGALSDLNMAIDIYPYDAEYYFNRGNVYNTMEKFENAVADYTSAIKLKPDYSEAYNNRGASFGSLNRLNESLDDYNKAISLNSKYAEAYYGRGLTKFILNDKNGACNDWSSALEFGYTEAESTLEMNCK